MGRLSGLVAALALAACGGGGSGATPDGGGQRDAATSATSCNGVGAPGNAKKVGEYCSKAGGQCGANHAGNGEATICAIDFDTDPTSTATFCTKTCVDATSCGADAVCIGGSPGALPPFGCVPLVCAPDWAKPDAGP